MKEKIHPKYEISSVTCACGNTFVTRSTRKNIKLEICSACHPFFTGKQRLLDSEGRVDKFKKRYAKTGGKTVIARTKKKIKKQPKKSLRVLSTAPKKVSKAKKRVTKPKKPKLEKKG